MLLFAIKRSLRHSVHNNDCEFAALESWTTTKHETCGFTYDWTDTDAQRAARAVTSHVRQMSFWIKCDRLVSGIITSHVTLSAVDTHLFINQCHDLLAVVQLSVRSNSRKSAANNFLERRLEVVVIGRTDQAIQGANSTPGTYQQNQIQHSFVCKRRCFNGGLYKWQGDHHAPGMTLLLTGRLRS